MSVKMFEKRKKKTKPYVRSYICDVLFLAWLDLTAAAHRAGLGWHQSLAVTCSCPGTKPAVLRDGTLQQDLAGS